jgi:hypothetical protein
MRCGKLFDKRSLKGRFMHQAWGKRILHEAGLQHERPGTRSLFEARW